MIVKRIPARQIGRDVTHERATHARRLIDYLRSPEKESAEKAYMVDYMIREGAADTIEERLFHIGSRGLVASSMEGQRLEMMALANAAKRSPNPVDHWLLSWPENELPTAEEIDKAVEMFLAHLCLDHQPCIYAAHGDTHNRHVHIAVNRYNSQTDRMIAINHGFNLEAAHQAVALIVEHFGWQAEPGQRYRIEDNKLALSLDAQSRKDDGRKGIKTAALAYELRTGYKSAQRIAQDEAVAILRSAQSWKDVHTKLAAIGMTYDRAGSNGAIIEVGGVKVTASRVHSMVTRVRLEKRLGEFAPRAPTLAIVPRAIDKDQFFDALRADEYHSLIEHRRRSAEAFPPNLESFYYSINEAELARHWRFRNAEGPFPSLSGTHDPDFTMPPEVDRYTRFPCAGGFRYARAIDAPTAFVVRGDRIDVVAATDDEAILAALRLAAVRFDGEITVRGSDEFRERVFNVAQRMSLAQFLVDPDFVERVDRINREYAKAPHDASVTSAMSPRPTPPATLSSQPTASQDEVEKRHEVPVKGPRRRHLASSTMIYNGNATWRSPSQSASLRSVRSLHAAETLRDVPSVLDYLPTDPEQTAAFARQTRREVPNSPPLVGNFAHERSGDPTPTATGDPMRAGANVSPTRPTAPVGRLPGVWKPSDISSAHARPVARSLENSSSNSRAKKGGLPSDAVSPLFAQAREAAAKPDQPVHNADKISIVPGATDSPQLAATRSTDQHHSGAGGVTLDSSAERHLWPKDVVDRSKLDAAKADERPQDRCDERQDPISQPESAVEHRATAISAAKAATHNLGSPPSETYPFRRGCAERVFFTSASAGGRETKWARGDGGPTKNDGY